MTDFEEFITQLVREREDLCILSLGTRTEEDGRVITEATLLKAGEPFPYTIVIRKYYTRGKNSILVKYRFLVDSLDLCNTLEFGSVKSYDLTSKHLELYGDFEKVEANFRKFLALFVGIFGKEVLVDE